MPKDQTPSIKEKGKAHKDELTENAALVRTTNKLATEFVPSILDREVAQGDLDAFGHRHFADALKGLIESPQHQPPYSIGLLGGWGTGKSSVKAMYLNELKDSTGPNSRSQKIKTITFNAWRFGGEDIRRALLRDVFVQLGGDETSIHDQFFSQTSQILSQPKSLLEMAKESWQRLLWIFVQLLAIFAFAVFLAWAVAAILHIDSEQYCTWLIAVFVAVGAFGFKVLEKTVVNRYTDVTKVELPKASAEQYEKLLKDHLIQWKAKERVVDRLVIFVDDLDRLSSEEMVDGLDAIRALMELPTGSGGIGVVFVISCDEDLVAEALSKRSRTATELPGAISNRQDARRYLDRIFQFRLEIPPLPRLDMRSFASQLLLRECFAQVIQRVVESGSSVDEITSRMIHVGVKNPRNAIQIVNAFAGAMWIAIKREFEGSSSTRPGALIEGSVTSHPISLAVLSALKVDFPEFYRVLQVEPGALEGFIHVFVRGDNPSDLPGSVAVALKPFSDGPTDDDHSGWKLQEKYSGLRQFISSVQAVQFPTSLQPLILLNQDEVSRRTGDVGARLYDPVVSGDVAGVLEALGHESDDRPLQLQEVEALFSIWELVESDSQDRRDGAAFVFARLIDRCQPDQSRKLAIPIAPTLAGSLELRNRIGVGTIESLMSIIRSQDAGALHNALADDYGIGDDKTVTARSQSGKAFTLEEAILAVQETVALLLSEWQAGRLSRPTQERLSQWLVERNVAVSEKAKKVLPFQVLDEWVTQYEEVLLPSVGVNYAFGVATELNAKEPSLAEKETARVRMLKVLKLESDGDGQFWPLLSEICALSDVESCLEAQSLGRAQLGRATPEQLSIWATVLSTRVTKFAGDGELHEDDKDAVNLLVGLCSTHGATLKKASEALRDCAVALSKSGESADQAVKLHRGIAGVSKESWVEVTSNWFERLSTDLPIQCSEELGRIANKCEQEPLISARSTALEACLEDSNEANPGSLNAFWISAERENQTATASMQQEGSLVLKSMSGAYTDFAATRPLWPTYRVALSTSNESPGGELHTLFTQAGPIPPSLAAVMEFMESEWPNIGKYTPLTAAFAIEKSLAAIQPLRGTEPETPLLKSLRVLVGDVELSEDEKDQIVSSVAPIWSSHPEESTALLISLSDRIWLEELSPLLDQWEADPNRLLQFMRQIMTALSTDLSQEDSRELFDKIVDRAPVATEQTNDAGLALLIEVLAPALARGLIEFVSDVNQPDEKKRRALERLSVLVPGSSGEWASDFLVGCALVQVLAPAEEAIRNLEASRNESDRYSISERLLRALPSVASTESKRALVRAVSELAGPAAGESFAKGSEATLEDLTLLSEYFPRSRKISNALKKKKN